MSFYRQLTLTIVVISFFFDKLAFAEFEGCAMAMMTQLQKNELLLNQMDSKLLSANLAIGGHGICGPTCMYNMFQTIKMETGIQIGMSDGVEEIRKFYFDAKAQRKPDIRTGVEIDDLAEYIQSEIRNSGVSAKVEVVRSPLKINEFIKPDRRVILSLSDTQSQGSHAVLLKAVDVQSKKMLIIDPNYPLTDTELSYTDNEGLLQVTAPELMTRYEWKNAYLSSATFITEIKVRAPKTEERTNQEQVISERISQLGVQGFSLSYYREEKLRVFYFNGNHVEGILEDYHDDGSDIGIVLDFKISGKLTSIQMRNIKNIYLMKK